jgi:hypothetical protein
VKRNCAHLWQWVNITLAVLRRFKFSFIFGFAGIAAIIILAQASFIPYDWRITDFVAILPMATILSSHILLPLV